jgi:hypothetical protein
LAPQHGKDFRFMDRTRQLLVSTHGTAWIKH